MLAMRAHLAAFRPASRRFDASLAHDPPAKDGRYVPHEPSPPWKRGKVHAIGGPVQIGYASGRDLLLVHSHQGRGLFDAVSGLRIARDDEDEWDVFDQARLTVRGFDVLEGEEARVADLFGGTLPRATADGFARPTQGDDERLLDGSIAGGSEA